MSQSAQSGNISFSVACIYTTFITPPSAFTPTPMCLQCLRQRALVAPGRPCPAPYAGWFSSLPKRIGRTEVRSPRPFRALVALAGRNLPPLCSPPRRRAGLSAMAQIERAYATYPTTLVVPLASTHATRCSQHRPPFALVRLLLLRCSPTKVTF